MNAAEARELTANCVPELAERATKCLEGMVEIAARNGNFSDCIEIGKVPTIFSITNKIVEHFENLGYVVGVTDLNEAVRITVSWMDAE